jgi:hypothetical protein
MDMLYQKNKPKHKLFSRKYHFILILCLVIVGGIIFIPGDQTRPTGRWAELAQSLIAQKEKPPETIKEKTFDQLLRGGSIINFV